MKYALSMLTLVATIFSNSAFSYAKIPEAILTHKSSVVTIYIEEDKKVIALGSGFIISSDGIIVTNNHVISPLNKGQSRLLHIKMSDGTFIEPLEVIAEDEEMDIALIKVKETNLPFIVVNTGYKPNQGDDVYVIGTPLGLETTISNGIISSIRGADGFLQISAPISHGNSGSPVLNSNGEAIGIATLVLTGGQNLNFAIPSQYITTILNKSKLKSDIAKPTTEQKNSDSICISYDDCMSKEDNISNNINRTKEDEEIASELLLKATKYAEKDSYNYYYALARYYIWEKDDALCTDSLEKAVKLGKNDFKTVKWLMWRYSHDRCDDAFKLLDGYKFGADKEQYADIISFYRDSPCKNISKGLRFELKYVDKMLELNHLDFFDSIYLMYESYGDTYSFKDDIDFVLNKYIIKYKTNYLLYHARANNFYETEKYSKALQDINIAYKLAPKEEQDLMMRSRVKIYMTLKQYHKALQDANIIINNESETSKVSFRTTRADIYSKLGEYQKAKKDLIISCDNNVFNACEKLTEFKANEDRGWNWVYFSKSTKDNIYYYDKDNIKSSKKYVTAWIKIKHIDNKYSDTYPVDIDCINSRIAVDQSQNKKLFEQMSPDSIYVTLKPLICNKVR